MRFVRKFFACQSLPIGKLRLFRALPHPTRKSNPIHKLTVLNLSMTCYCSTCYFIVPDSPTHPHYTLPFSATFFRLFSFLDCADLELCTCTIVSSSMDRILESDFRTHATVFRPTCFTLFSSLNSFAISVFLYF